MRRLFIATISALLVVVFSIANIKESLSDSKIGSGPLTLSQRSYYGFQEYLRGNKGKPLVFAVSPNGKHYNYRYCTHGKLCSKFSNYIRVVLKDCRSYADRDCFIFAREKEIVWKDSNGQPVTLSDVSRPGGYPRKYANLNIDTICTMALVGRGKGIKWDPKAGAWKKEAEHRGYTPESCDRYLGRPFSPNIATTTTTPSKSKPTVAKAKSNWAAPIWSVPAFQRGKNAYEKGDYATALKFWEPIERDGDPTFEYYVASAQKRLGIKKKQTASSPPLTPAPPKKVASTPNIPSAPAKDTTPPTIDITSAITVETDSPTVHGRVSDDNRVAQVTVNGVAADLRNGRFSFTRYVPSSGTTVQIEAIDEWGNKSARTVKLTRSITDTSDQQSFASLDPTKINGRSNQDAVALIIGVADYSRAPKAAYADNDASVFSDYARRALGIPQSNIKVLTNGDASLVDLKVGVRRWLRGRIEEGKTDVYVFYAGHGLASSDGQDLYLLPQNGEPSLLEETSLLRNDMFDVIANANPRSATVFLDTCYSGLSRGEETLLASARPILITPKQQKAPIGFTVFSAASGQQISSGLDEAKHGLFSYYLMKGMEGPADTNKDKMITVGELHAYVQKNVKRQAIRLGREQIPELQGDAERVLVRW
ncbi:MAG: caspase family protein [Rhodospirillales bacterium]|nr:caspase family protein [Rhodospirillales bacterium]